jgi:hypothetical protein
LTLKPGAYCAVICGFCSTIYNLCGVKTLVRYEDCTEFETPCCHRKTDTRLDLTHAYVEVGFFANEKDYENFRRDARRFGVPIGNTGTVRLVR